MKTSKIILISIFASIIILFTIGFFTAINGFKNFIEKNNIEIKPDEKNNKTEKSFALADFSVLEISGNGNINIEQSNKNEIKYFSDETKKTKIKNDTLFVYLNKNNVILKLKKLNTVITKNKTGLTVTNIKTNYLKIYAGENSHISANNIKTDTLYVFAKNNAFVEIYDIEGKNIMSEFVLSGNSETVVDKIDNLNINIKKEDNAKLNIGL